MKEGKTITLNDKGISLIIIVILVLILLLSQSSIKREGTEVTTFTREELERISKLQDLEDKTGSGADIYAYKDENGNLMIGWDYKDSESAFWK